MDLNIPVVMLNMNGGIQHAKIKDYMRKEAIIQPYVEKTPEYFSFFLDVDFKKTELSLPQKLSLLDLWLPEEERWIARCTEWKGFHVIFPNISCSKEEALSLFQTLPNPHNVLDASVYRSGLRILFAPKPNEPRWYIPYEKRTKECIISLEEKMYPEFFITKYQPDNLKQHLCSTPKRTTTRNKIQVRRDGTMILLTYERECRNLKSGVHRSNHIYYEIKGNFKYQRCWCRCETKENRKYGYCKSYRSEPIPIGWKEKKQLLQNFKETNSLFHNE